MSTHELVRARHDHERHHSRFASQFLSYDGTKLDAAKRAVGARSTAKLRNELDAAMDRVAPALKGTKARASGTVTGVYVGDVDANNATTVVTIDVVMSSTEVQESVQQQVLSLGLVKVDGEWQVDKATNLRATGATTGATTATTAPTTAP